MLTTENGAALVAPTSDEVSNVKIKLKRNTVISPGLDGESGKVYDVDDKTARYLIGIKKAVGVEQEHELVKELKDDDKKEQPKALEKQEEKQAKGGFMGVFSKDKS